MTQLRMTIAVWLLPAVLYTSSAKGDSGNETPKPDGEGIVFYESRIRPLLAAHCYRCHTGDPEEISAGLRLDSLSSMLSGGASGPAVVPGKPDAGLLMRAVRHEDPNFAMPPPESGEGLTNRQIQDLEQWIRMGAPAPADAPGQYTTMYDTESAKEWWAYQPLTEPSVPAVADQSWPRGNIDQFVLAAREAAQLENVDDAEKSALLRRVCMDLAGLPPSPELQEWFETSSDPLAYTRVVDRLLSQPQFGERWGRHWLDVARYAETTGRDLNLTMPEAWRYRDYVIVSFNEDKAFDQFIIEQIAGDLLPSEDDTDRAAKLIATGFLAVGPKGLNESDPRQFAVELADEQVGTVSQAFLGMTLSCARCHDHKFAPITQVDYTAVAGIFLSTETHYGTPGGVRGRNASDLTALPASASLPTSQRRMNPRDYAQKQRQLQTITARRDAALRARAPRDRMNSRDTGAMQFSGFDLVRMMTRIAQIESEIAGFYPDGSPRPRAMTVSDKPERLAPRSPRSRTIGGPNSRGRASSGFEVIGDSPLFLRGSIDSEADRVPRGLPGFLSGDHVVDIPSGSSGRLELARWIASDRNSLTSRVIVNRVWAWLFGRGLVAETDNFGASGQPPSHPELLDYLATQFVKQGWSLKQLIREIVLSRTYQMASDYSADNYKIDPENIFLWHHRVKRLDAESLRDSVLSATGQLNLQSQVSSLIAEAGEGPVGGQRTQAITENQILKIDAAYRSVYLPIARGVQPELLAAFDYADPNFVVGQRDQTIVPPQALYLMNSSFMQQQAEALAARVRREPDFSSQFKLACRLTLCRSPQPAEAAAARAFLNQDPEAWTSVCRALMSGADFLFVR